MKKGGPTPFKIEWQAHEHEYKERSSDWFWAVGIVAFSIAAVSVIFGNIIFGILVLTGTFAMALFINREPSVINVRVDERGITKDRTHYPYESLESFWIDTDHSHPKILLRSQKFFIPLIIVPLGDETDEERLESTLLQFLTHRHHQMPFVERLIEYIGF